jgi:hypothetical protein
MQVTEATHEVRTFAAAETTGGFGFTVETLNLGNAEFDAFRRDNGQHTNLTIRDLAAVQVFEFAAGTVHIDVRETDGTGHSISLRSADDVEAMIALLTNALANRTVLS